MPNFIAYTLSYKIETNIDTFNVINLFLVMHPYGPQQDMLLMY